MTSMTVKLSPLWHGSGQSWVHPSGRGLVQGSSQTWHSLPAYIQQTKKILVSEMFSITIITTTVTDCS